MLPLDLPRAMLGLWHVALNVRDLGAMERFYAEVIGMRVEWKPDPKNTYLTTGKDNLALHEIEGLPPPGTIGVLDHLGFVVDSYDAVDRWHLHILGKCGKADTEPRTHRDGARSFYFRDPEENRIQLICHPPILDALARV
jgi:catechol-2,3-dioxygenase